MLITNLPVNIYQSLQKYFILALDEHAQRDDKIEITIHEYIPVETHGVSSNLSVNLLPYHHRTAPQSQLLPPARILHTGHAHTAKVHTIRHDIRKHTTSIEERKHIDDGRRLAARRCASPAEVVCAQRGMPAQYMHIRGLGWLACSCEGVRALCSTPVMFRRVRVELVDEASAA